MLGFDWILIGYWMLTSAILCFCKSRGKGIGRIDFVGPGLRVQGAIE